MSLNIEEIRAMFPVLHQEVNGKPLIYFDNAATTQKPQSVLDALTGYYEHDNSNIHRGAHTLADRATRFSSSIVSKTPREAAHASGLPPYVPPSPEA